MALAGLGGFALSGGGGGLSNTTDFGSDTLGGGDFFAGKTINFASKPTTDYSLMIMGGVALLAVVLLAGGKR